MLFLTSAVSSAQNKEIDSLNVLLTNAKTRIDSIKTYSILASKLTVVNPNESILLSQKLLKLSKQEKNILGFIDAYISMGEANIHLANYTNSIKQFDSALALAEKNNLTSQIANIYKNKGRAYTYMSNYKTAIMHYNKSLALYRKIGDNNSIADNLVSLSAVATETKDFDNSESFLNEALKLYKTENNIDGIIKSKKNMAIVIAFQGNNKKALELLMEVAKIEEEFSDNEIQKIATLLNIAAIYYNLENYIASKKYYLQTLVKLQKIDNKMLRAKCTYHLALIEHQNLNSTQALEYALESYKLSKETSNLKTLAQSSKLLAIIYIEKNNKKEAIKYVELTSDYNDSLRTQNVQGALFDERIKFETKELALKKEHELKQLALKKDKEFQEINNRRNIYIFLGSILFFTLLYGIMYLNKVKLKNINKKLTISNETKSNFLTKMSHEIKTPLNAIIGYTDLLFKTTQLTIEQSKFISIIENSSKSLLTMTEDIFDFNKYNKDKLQLHYTPTHIKRTAEEVFDLMKIKADNKKIKTLFSFDENIPETLIIDELKLRRVLYNLLNNAIKFTSEGTITLSINAASKSENFTELLIAVKDTGKGIDAKNRYKIFHEFFQEESDYTREHGGIGLGLSIAKKIINKMGGKLEFTSELGKGSTFFFKLKLKNGITQKTTNTTIEDIPKKDNFFKFLIVEDNKINLLLTKKILITLHKDAVILEAYNGKEGVELYKKEKPDLILMDIQMPVMNGFEASLIIRKSDPNVSILALSAGSAEENEEKSIAAGINEYIEKPITITKLKEVLNKHLFVS